ncbi:Zinc finger, CCHC-type [Cynara cardunculus var. scolymus]|uniref:Zinc finger, CCHC-type n=1 Tax=Cynara cardunculus var. scolymus TaxID=59895 RepID=A0A103XBK7_CYNCS|nr:Zinc finger, CCHC-type [Cynara cardunculus var. scolymus]
MKKIKKRKKEKMGVQDNVVEDVEIKEEGDAPKQTDVTLETNPSEKSDSIVLRKLLHGPRYLDRPYSNWGNCYNCGEGGHTAVNCTSAKHKKPCFVCGSLEHNVKQRNKVWTCK